MKNVCWLFVLLLVLISCTAAPTADTETNKNHTVGISDISDDHIEQIIDFVYGLYHGEDQYIPYEYDVRGHEISPFDIRIDVDGADITVHLLAQAPDKKSFISVDYVLLSSAADTFEIQEVTAYPDDRNDCDYEIAVEGVSVEIPLVEISVNGTQRYAVNHRMVNLSQRSFPDDPLTLQPFHYNHNKTNSLFIQNDRLYISIQHYGICDVYVYHLTEKTGSWMSGAASLDEAYAKEIAWIQENDVFFNYTLNEIAAISEETGWFAVRRSTEIGTYHGAYDLYQPTTGEKLFVCDSFPSDSYTTYDMEWVIAQNEGFVFYVYPASSVQQVYSAQYTETGWEITMSDR